MLGRETEAGRRRRRPLTWRTGLQRAPELLAGVVARAHERAGLDVGDAERLAVGLVPLELLGGDPMDSATESKPPPARAVRVKR